MTKPSKHATMDQLRSDDFFRWPVLEACQQLHMHNTGSSDALSEVEALEMRLWLLQRRAVWSAPTCKFDDFVLALVVTTLDETKSL